ncbi:MAG: S8 family serine peptidase [bacterium]|nr:S8 family serine peptidase [bacterium]
MKHVIFAALVLGIFVGIVSAAVISPNFDAELSRVAKDEFVSGIIILESPIDVRELDLSLHERGAKRAERYNEIYNALRVNARMTQPKFQGELEAGKELGLVEGYTAYWIENLFIVSAKAEFFNALRNRSDIMGLSENFEAVAIEPIRSEDSVSDDEIFRRPRNPLDDEFTTPGQDAIGATRVNRELGITGHGVLVANLDTGVDGTHPALASRWRGLSATASAAWHDLLNQVPTTFPTDGNSHGTHVMGTICGREISGTDTTTVGGAPDAEWIACNAINQGVGNAFDNDVINAYQWFANPDGDSTTLDDVPDVVQNSWGVNGGLGYVECWDLWNATIVNLEALGCVVTFSAGNEGPNAQTMRSPAIHALSEVQMFSVGAAQVLDGDTPPFDIASFSSRGPSPCQGTAIKPEITAPGVSVFSSVPGGGYSDGFSGTSMAGPHIAGVVALMREACPQCDAITIKEALLSTAIDEGYGNVGNDNTFGFGFVDAFAAVQAVFNLGFVQGVVTSAGQPIDSVTVSAEGSTRVEMTDATGAYRFPLSAGTYTIRFTKFGYHPVTVAGVVVVENDTTFQDVSMTLSPMATVSGHVFDADNNPLAGATVKALAVPVAPVATDIDGSYSLPLPTELTYTLRAYGTRGAAQSTFVLNADTTIDFYMPSELFCYDFESGNQGWTIGAVGDNATLGIWNRMDPDRTINLDSIVCQPDTDHTANGVNCFVTDGRAGNGVGANDVDGGRTTLLSPIWDLSAESNAVIELYTWFTNDNGNNPGQDYFDVDVSSDSGATWLPMLHENVDWEEWRRETFVLEDYIPLTNAVRVRVAADDQPLGSLVEALVDDVCILTSGILPPENLTVLVVSNGMQLSWLPVMGASSYTIWRGTQFPPTLENSAILTTVTSTSYIDLTTLDTLGFYIVTANR